MSFFEDVQLLLAGFVPVRDFGFALPAFCTAASDTAHVNSWYRAIPEIDGDRRSSIADFDRLDFPDVELLAHPIAAKVGDPWLDVFLWNGRQLADTPNGILSKVTAQTADLRRTAPLSLLELTLAASDRKAVSLVRRTSKFLLEELGPEDAAFSFEEIVVRPGVLVRLRRILHRLGTAGRSFDIDSDVDVVTRGSTSFSVEASEALYDFLGPDSLTSFQQDLEQFSRQTGLDLELMPSGATTELPTGEINEFVSPEGIEREEEKATIPSGLVPLAQRRTIRSVRSIVVQAGTRTVRVGIPSHGIVADEPSFVAYERKGDKWRMLGVGQAAIDLLAGHPEPEKLRRIMPWAEGDIVDEEGAIDILRFLVKRLVGRQWLRRLHITAIVPLGMTTVQRRALRGALVEAGAGRVSLIETALAAALGAYLPVQEPIGSLIIDVGTGSTDIAVISVSGVAYGTSSRVGTDVLDSDIVTYLRNYFGFVIGRATAAAIRKEMGVALPPADGTGESIEIKGRESASGNVKTLIIDQGHLAKAVSPRLASLIDATRIALENTTPELAADIVDHGIVLSGEGSILSGLDELFRNETGLPVIVADDPSNCAIWGALRVLETPALADMAKQL